MKPSPVNRRLANLVRHKWWPQINDDINDDLNKYDIGVYFRFHKTSQCQLVFTKLRMNADPDSTSHSLTGWLCQHKLSRRVSQFRNDTQVSTCPDTVITGFFILYFILINALNVYIIIWLSKFRSRSCRVKWLLWIENNSWKYQLLCKRACLDTTLQVHFFQDLCCCFFLSFYVIISL